MQSKAKERKRKEEKIKRKRNRNNDPQSRDGKAMYSLLKHFHEIELITSHSQKFILF